MLRPLNAAVLLLLLRRFFSRYSLVGLLVALATSPLLAQAAVAPAEPGPFFEAEQPFFHTQVEIASAEGGEAAQANFVVRGVVLPLSSGHAVIFDQELLRLAALTEVPRGEPPVTLRTMAQISYAVARRKASGEHPRPTGRVLLHAGMHPGVASNLDALRVDPRPQHREGDFGRGGLPVDFGRFEGIALTDDAPVLHYRSGNTGVQEWFEAATQNGETRFHRHFVVEPHAEPLHVTVGVAEGRWLLANERTARAEFVDGARVQVAASSAEVSLVVVDGELNATFAPTTSIQHATLAMVFGSGATVGTPNLGDTTQVEPAVPGPPSRRRWPQSVSAPVELSALSENGLILDRIAVPEENPWKRRVRVADIAFLDEDRAAVVTYDGDVWIVVGLADPALGNLTWSRFASGLHEPLALVAPGGAITVATKNGLVRLHDRNADGEADWFENFNDQIVQSQTTRSFPLDLAVAPDGSLFFTQGGIVTQSGIPSGGTGTSHAGAIVKISPDGRHTETFAGGAREPFVTVHPITGLVTATDQQGHFIPSSVCYLVRPGDSYGFPEPEPKQLTPPLVWIPHDQDSASSSQLWLVGQGMGQWADRLLHLSYGTGRLFVITPDLQAPTPQGAAIPLGLSTDLPLLHARMHPRGDAAYLVGFQIYGTRTRTAWALGRLRPGQTPIKVPLAARSVERGVILDFGAPLDPASLRSDHVNARVWNYQRSAAYGSGRYKPDGEPGTLPIGVGKVVLAEDGQSVFVHLPDLAPTMQLEVRTAFKLASGEEAGGYAYLTVHQPAATDLAAAGFSGLDLSDSQPVIAPLPEEDPSLEQGAALAQSLGCTACHSTDGSGGRIGPTWRGLYGSQKRFADGSVDNADEFYLREKILEPLKRRLSLDQAEMPSYRGVITDNQLESLVIYLKSLRAPAPRQ